MDIIAKLAEELKIRPAQAEAAVKLLDEGCTVPFIARYRKEATGSLNDETLRALCERLEYLRNLEEKKQQVLARIEEQGLLDQELREKVLSAATLVEVEDLYRPFRPKRRTRASVAKEKGLEGLANILLLQRTAKTPEEEAAAFVNPEKDVQDVKAALAGAMDIIAEQISDQAQYRTRIREMTKKEGVLSSDAKDEAAAGPYEMYYNYEEEVRRIAGHRVLALNRAEKEKAVTVRLDAPEERILSWLGRQVIRPQTRTQNPETARLLEDVCQDAYRRLIEPAIEREIRGELTQMAQEGAISVFGKNLKQLLMQPPVAGRNVLGWDPAFRTGCKLAVVDQTGRVLETGVIYPTAPTNPAKIAAAKETCKKLIRKYNISVIAVGNGTTSRESEQIIVELLREIPEKVSYVIVNEAGASVYSASKLGTEEFPDLDVGGRSAASIARRLQDPLAELVKIDPKSIGVGQYQHDMDQKRLDQALTGVVEDCVNQVGVDLNTASVSLLSYVSGITKTTAAGIVAYRNENQRFKNRRELLKVPKLGPKAFEQCAGFLRIRGGNEPLDSTAVHPESYQAAKALLEKLGSSPKEIGTENMHRILAGAGSLKQLSSQLGIGAETLKDIVSELEKPGRDPRDEMPEPVLRSDILEMKDLKSGMILKGTVRNVIDFGAFVDIGVHQDGLVHISQMSDRKFVKHPLEVVSVGDIVEVKILDVDLDRKRISLTMKL